jgi:hypothetical protein
MGPFVARRRKASTSPILSALAIMSGLKRSSVRKLHNAVRGTWISSASCTFFGDTEQRAWAQKAVDDIWSGSNG